MALTDSRLYLYVFPAKKSKRNCRFFSYGTAAKIGFSFECFSAFMTDWLTHSHWYEYLTYTIYMHNIRYTLLSIRIQYINTYILCTYTYYTILYKLMIGFLNLIKNNNIYTYKYNVYGIYIGMANSALKFPWTCDARYSNRVHIMRIHIWGGRGGEIRYDMLETGLHNLWIWSRSKKCASFESEARSVWMR